MNVDGSLAVRAVLSNLTDLDIMFATIRREFRHLDGVFVAPQKKVRAPLKIAVTLQGAAIALFARLSPAAKIPFQTRRRRACTAIGGRAEAG
jgi:hypothetical protein